MLRVGRRAAGHTVRPRAESSEGRGLSNTPSLLRRAGAALSICIVLGGVLSGCAPKKSGSTASPSPTFNPHYAKSAELAANLQALGPVSGDMQGTMTVGNETRNITGYVALNGTSSLIRLVETAKTSTTFVETVVAGSRYTSHDDKVWVARGAKTKSQTLAALLAAADTSVDAGVKSINKISAHEIMTAQDKVDVAPALGLDTGTFDAETTTLHVWADDSGKVLGFGASMSWSVFVGGIYLDVVADLDVMFTSNTPVTINVPDKPWKWAVDLPMGIGLAYPGGNADVNSTIRWQSQSAGTYTVSSAISQAQSAVPGFASGTNSTLIDSEDALWFTTSNEFTTPMFHITVKANTDSHLAVLMVIHEKILYSIVVIGSAKDQLALDLFAMQVFTTVEFTR
jgi:hypothetical protein